MSYDGQAAAGHRRTGGRTARLWSTTGPAGTRYLTKGTFTCKLYDDEGNVMLLKDGRFSLATIMHN